MSANRQAAEIAQRHGLDYHAVRRAINQLVDAGWDRPDAERYIDESLVASWNLGYIVHAALEEER